MTTDGGGWTKIIYGEIVKQSREEILDYLSHFGNISQIGNTLYKDYEKVYRELEENLHNKYQEKFEEWKKTELENMRKTIHENVKKEFEAEMQKQKAEHEKRYRELSENIHKYYQEKFEEWKKTELENIKKTIHESVKKEFEAEFQKWKQEEEEKIRNDAIQRSCSTILGKVGEQLAPLLLFENYGINLKDIRFLGSPVDFIVFKGLYDGNPEEIIFVEVKSGNSTNLTPRERMVKKLIEEKKVSWKTFHTKTEINKILTNNNI